MARKAKQTGDLDEFERLTTGPANPVPRRKQALRSKRAPIEIEGIAVAEGRGGGLPSRSPPWARFPLEEDPVELPPLVPFPPQPEVLSVPGITTPEIPSRGTSPHRLDISLKPEPPEVLWFNLREGQRVTASISGEVVRVIKPQKGRPETGMLVLRVGGSGLLALHPEVDGSNMKIS